MIGLTVAGWTASGVGLLLWCAQVGALRAGARRREEHVARAAHEVRGPLTAALMALHSLAAKGVGADGLRAVEGELRRAARCLEDLHDAPDGRWTPDERESVDLVRHGRLQAEDLGAVAAARERQVRFESELDCAWVHADPLRISQVIGNLVANALEHGAGTIVVAVRKAGGGFALEVRDEGDGLSAPLPELIARPRAGEGRRGRGLAIATELATRAGGHLGTAPSRRGARFVFELPADRLSLANRIPRR